jgi:hypothetical protein
LVESFNGRMRDELLNEMLFFDLGDARTKIAAWVAAFVTEIPPHAAYAACVCRKSDSAILMVKAAKEGS